ncbi:MAG: hypothetical protein HY897_18725, partial [Deltaproteobacteria bacterium]|nr:hypothetical protein [Deltaproteobacteria bacterium]
MKRLFTRAFWTEVYRAVVAAMVTAWEAAPKSVFQHVALWMVFVCLVTFTGGPLMAQTYDAHRKRVEREERILKNLGLDEATLARNRAAFLARTGSAQDSGLKAQVSLPVGPHALDLHKPIEVGEVGRVAGDLRAVEDAIARKETHLGRDPSATADLEHLYETRDTTIHRLTKMGVDVEKMKANAPKMPRYVRP